MIIYEIEEHLPRYTIVSESRHGAWAEGHADILEEALALVEDLYNDDFEELSLDCVCHYREGEDAEKMMQYWNDTVEETQYFVYDNETREEISLERRRKEETGWETFYDLDLFKQTVLGDW